MSQNIKHARTVLRAGKMDNRNWSTGVAVATFLIGVILFWSFGKDWLNFDSPLVFLAGLTGVAFPVLIFAAWNIYRHSRKDK